MPEPGHRRERSARSASARASCSCNTSVLARRKSARASESARDVDRAELVSFRGFAGARFGDLVAALPLLRGGFARCRVRAVRALALRAAGRARPRDRRRALRRARVRPRRRPRSLPPSHSGTENFRPTLYAGKTDLSVAACGHAGRARQERPVLPIERFGLGLGGAALRGERAQGRPVVCGCRRAAAQRAVAAALRAARGRARRSRSASCRPPARARAAPRAALPRARSSSSAESSSSARAAESSAFGRAPSPISACTRWLRPAALGRQPARRSRAARPARASCR